MQVHRFCGFVALCIALAAAIAAPARAERLDLERVPADAVWLMHADMDAARESTVMRRMYERIVSKHPEVENMMGMAAGLAGMDPRKDLHDVTVYGLDTDKKNAVMIVHADANRGFLEKMVEKARDHQTMKHRDYVLHAWSHKGWKGHRGGKVVGAFFKDDMMVFARSADRVKTALDVLEGKAEPAGPKSPLAGRTRPGSILVARASKVDPDTKCPVLRQGEGFRVAMGESEGESFYRARLDMESDQAAELAEDVAEGLAATVALGLGGEKGVLKLVEGLETMTRGKTCLLAWNARADDVWDVAEAMAEKIEVKIEARMSAKAKAACGCDTCGCDTCDATCGKKGCSACESGQCPGEKPTAKNEGSDPHRPFEDDEF